MKRKAVRRNTPIPKRSMDDFPKQKISVLPFRKIGDRVLILNPVTEIRREWVGKEVIRHEIIIAEPNSTAYYAGERYALGRISSMIRIGNTVYFMEPGIDFRFME